MGQMTLSHEAGGYGWVLAPGTPSQYPLNVNSFPVVWQFHPYCIHPGDTRTSVPQIRMWAAASAPAFHGSSETSEQGLKWLPALEAQVQDQAALYFC